MSAKLRRRRNTVSGPRSFYFVDKTIKLPDGSKYRLREVPTDQTKRGAEQFEQDRVREILEAWREGRLSKKPVKEIPCQTLRQFFPRFMAEYVVGENKPSEQESKTDIFENHLLPFFGDIQLTEIKSADIDKFKAEQLTKITVRGKPLSKKTVNNQLTVLRKALAQARDWEILPEIPVVRFYRKLPPPPFDFLTFDEAERLLAAAKSEPVWHAMLLVALKTGLRRGELRALRWSDVDFDRRIVHVRQSLRRQTLGLPKGGRAREVEMSDDVKTVLLAHHHDRCIYVFCREDGEHFTEGDTRAPLERIRKRAGLRHMMWHVCRHTFCSHLVMRGIPLRVVQLLAGHTSYKVTERYAHLSPEIRGQAVRVLDRLPRVEPALVELDEDAAEDADGAEDADAELVLH